MGIKFDEIVMGQGVVARFGNALETSTMPSCLGVAFINRKDRSAGLFHYPAKGFSGPAEKRLKQAMIAMSIECGSDEIYLTPAKSMAGYGYAVQQGSSQEDISAVMEFLDEMFVSATVQVLNGSSFASVDTTGNKIIFNSATNADVHFNVNQHVVKHMTLTDNGEVPRDNLPVSEHVVVYAVAMR